MILEHKQFLLIIGHLFLLQHIKCSDAERKSDIYKTEPPLIVPGSKPMEKLLYIEENNVQYQCVQKCYPVLKQKLNYLPKTSPVSTARPVTVTSASILHVSPFNVKILRKTGSQATPVTFCQFLCLKYPLSDACVKCKPRFVKKYVTIKPTLAQQLPKLPVLKPQLSSPSFCELICHKYPFSTHCVRCRSQFQFKLPKISILTRVKPIKSQIIPSTENQIKSTAVHVKLPKSLYLIPPKPPLKLKKTAKLFPETSIVTQEKVTPLVNFSQPILSGLNVPKIASKLVPTVIKDTNILMKKPLPLNSIVVSPQPRIIYNSMRCCYLDKCMILPLNSVCPSICYEPCDAFCTNRCLVNPNCPNKCNKISYNLKQYKTEFMIWLHTKLNQIKFKHRQMVEKCILRTKANYVSEIRKLQAQLIAAHPYLFSDNSTIQEPLELRRAHGISINILGQQNIGAGGTGDTNNQNQPGQFHVSQNIGINNQDSSGYDNGSNESAETTTRATNKTVSQADA